MSLIEAKNIKKVYKTGDVSVEALKGIDLKIEKGEFTCLVGSSGCGKTSLLNILNGLDTPSEGEVLINGKRISDMSSKQLSDFRRDHVGFIFQSYNLIPVLTVKENIEYLMMLQKKSKKERDKKVEELLELLGLKDMKNRKPSQMSGGQQQRVAVARAIITSPDIVLADEPTANLDSKTSKALLEMMKDLNEKKGITFLFSTHDPVVMNTAKRIVRLKDGLIIEDSLK